MTDIDAEPDAERIEGTFLVTAAEGTSAVLKDVETGQVLTLSSNPGVERGDVIEGIVSPDPPMNVSYQLVDASERRTLSIERSEEPPTANSADTAAEQDIGEITRGPRAGTGEVHVITVPEDSTEAAVDDILEDEERLLSRAARLGVNRVEIRTSPGVLSVRYLP
jgi:hypothetical protein